MFNQKTNSTLYIFWFQWVLLSVIGLLVDTWIIFGLGVKIPPLFPVTTLTQWVLLRQKIEADRWLFLTPLGFCLGCVAGVGFIIINYLSPLHYQISMIDNIIPGLIFGALFGAISGGMQWIVLYRQIRKAYFWLLASSLGWGLGFSIGFEVIDKSIWSNRAVGDAFAFTVTAIIAMSITGFMLARGLSVRIVQ